MNKEESEVKIDKELPDSWWYRVYAAVAVTTVIVIALLWAFSQYFSS
ncbi:MAG: hypothetical protein KIS76_01440 [Pyrinomonadaceae bacterium]|nr:hypothetical protein [Pyrinomonadaceae bacterium]